MITISIQLYYFSIQNNLMREEIMNWLKQRMLDGIDRYRTIRIIRK